MQPWNLYLNVGLIINSEGGFGQHRESEQATHAMMLWGQGRGI